MRKIIKKQGNSLIIRITSDDAEIYNLQEDDVVQIEIYKLKKKDLKHGSNK
jgi:antitoxin component of MazEF toxin-antitoxin module